MYCVLCFRQVHVLRTSSHGGCSGILVRS